MNPIVEAVRQLCARKCKQLADSGDNHRADYACVEAIESITEAEIAAVLPKAELLQRLEGLLCRMGEGRHFSLADRTDAMNMLLSLEPIFYAALVAPVVPEDVREWLIWSNEHRAWWASNRCGYRADPRDAGRYTLTEAMSVCRIRSWDGNTPPETMLHVSLLAKAYP